MELKQNINDAIKTRGENRRQKVEIIANRFYNFLNNGKYQTFSKGLFLSFMPDEINDRTRQRLTREVFNLLECHGRITPTTEYKNYVSLRNKSLFSWDYGSYHQLMKRNGYTMAYYVYQYDHNTRSPKKIKVGSSRVGESVNFDYDIAEPVSYKPREKQAVTTNSRLSVVRDVVKRKVCLYQVN